MLLRGLPRVNSALTGTVFKETRYELQTKLTQSSYFEVLKSFQLLKSGWLLITCG